MDSFDHELEHPKKRRRREVERRPLVACLAFDDSIKGDAAIVPQGLWSRLVDGHYGMLRQNHVQSANTELNLQMRPLHPQPRTSRSRRGPLSTISSKSQLGHSSPPSDPQKSMQTKRISLDCHRRPLPASPC